MSTCAFIITAEGEEKSGADCQVKIKLIAPPMYVMTCMTLDKELGLETMNHCIEVIATTIRAKGYVFIVGYVLAFKLSLYYAVNRLCLEFCCILTFWLTSIFSRFSFLFLAAAHWT